MVKKTFTCGISVLFLALVCYAGPAFTSTDSGPESMELTSSTGDKMAPAVFPHKVHQEAYECGECHHGMEDGEKVEYTEGMEIQKCESCHNSDVLEGKKKGKEDLATFKGAGHGNCLECHKEVAKADSSKKKLRSCTTCHQKK